MTDENDDCVICGAPFDRTGVMFEERADPGNTFHICLECFADYRKAHPRGEPICHGCDCDLPKMDS